MIPFASEACNEHGTVKLIQSDKVRLCITNHRVVWKKVIFMFLIIVQSLYNEHLKICIRVLNIYSVILSEIIKKSKMYVFHSKVICLITWQINVYSKHRLFKTGMDHPTMSPKRPWTYLGLIMVGKSVFLCCLQKIKIKNEYKIQV